MLSSTPASAPLAAVKARQQAAWSSGDYAVIGTTLQLVGETLCESLDVRDSSFWTLQPVTEMQRWRRRGAAAR